ncbi:uncharacterized protein EV422DRAFT_539906 [Fimicolochytrium jonesii]|uniref:uncharacterized protein n=1 Tax=Fimicolochytrium jonesii TaxID=1396493 RepID=UPI0022FDC060|nr:uncharacterized protein EV422DRAFT_539906 [Fimicolochytrium jonesii]KAI8817779.1 hypothetical protein EV422DRAFT_539906 [Fimicolochytrium jonesii]
MPKPLVPSEKVRLHERAIIAQLKKERAFNHDAIAALMDNLMPSRRGFEETVLDKVWAQYYASIDYEVINLIQRNPKDPFLTHNEHQAITCFLTARYLALLMRLGTRTPKDMTLYRGISIRQNKLDQFRQTYVPGRRIITNEFMSTTPTLDIAHSFTMYPNSAAVMMVLSIPRGTPIDVGNNHAVEEEAVLHNCTQWRVDAMHMIDPNTFRVYMHLEAMSTPFIEMDDGIEALCRLYEENQAGDLMYTLALWDDYRKGGGCANIRPVRHTSRKFPSLKGLPTAVVLFVKGGQAVAPGSST